MRNLLFVLGSILFFVLGFPPYSVLPLMMLAWVPLLWLWKAGKSVWWAPVIFLGWNIGCIGWLGEVEVNQVMALVPALIVNTGLFSLAWWLVRRTWKRLPARWAWISLPVAWVPVEWIHFYWDLDFPWLTVGNALAEWPIFAQGYEIAGSSLGSLWILGINGLVFSLLKKEINWNRKAGIAIAIWIMFPLFFLPLGWRGSNAKMMEVTVVQPNIETYQEKYDWGKYADQFHSMALLSEKEGNGDWIIWPETAVPGNFPIRFPAGFDRKSLQIWQWDSLENLSSRLKNKNLVVGASCYGVFLDSLAPNGQRVETYNAFLWFRNGALQGIYQKSKMVAGVEKIPFVDLIPGLKSLSLDFGGTTESLQGQDTLSIFNDGKSSVCPLICFEQDFGRHASKGNWGNFIAIGTNDGWWSNSNGHLQHFEIARLRAIENRKWVARAANTGKSGFIDPQGKAVGKTLNWNDKGVITQKISLEERTTWYARWGDYWVVFLSMALLGIQFLKTRKN